jgi:hypothetical protein
MKRILNLLAFTLTLSLLVSACTKSNTNPIVLNDIYCQIYAVDTTTSDTTKIEDIDKYFLTDKNVQYYEDWFGIKPTTKGYQYYDCWLK